MPSTEHLSSPKIAKKRAKTLKDRAKNNPNELRTRLQNEEVKAKRKAAILEWRKNNPEEYQKQLEALARGRDKFNQERKLKKERLEKVNKD